MGRLLEFTSTVHITNLLVGSSRCAVGGSVFGRLGLGILLIDNHTLGTDGVFLGRGAEALVTFTAGGLGIRSHARLLLDDVEHGVLEGLLVLRKAVLLPGVVKSAGVQIVSAHALLKEAQAGSVVGLLLKFERSTVFHILTELRRVATAKLLKGSLNLLFLNVVVLFVLGATW